MLTRNLDVVAVTETWLKEGQDWQLNIPGYKCFRRDRGGTKRGGGVAVLVKEHITAVQREDNSEGSCNESLWVELRNRKGAVTMLGVYYRPPNSPREVEERICQEILDRCKKNRVVVAGDFNFPGIDWKSRRAGNLNGEEFVKCVQEGALEQYVDSPTREGAILDLVLGNEPGQVFKVSVGEHVASSDHNSISFRIAMEKDEWRPKGKVLDWGKANFSGIRQKLAAVDWERLFEDKSTSGMWESFREQLVGMQDRHVPVKKKDRKGRIREPWITREIEGLVKMKREAYVRSRQLKTEGALEKYKESRKELKQGIRRAKRSHEMTLADRIKENPKAFYSYVRNKRVVREKVGPLRDKSGELCLEPKEVGEILNEYFASVFTKERDVLTGSVSEVSVDPLEKISITREEVLGLLGNIKTDKSPGPDGI